MRELIVGDPHATPDDLADMDALMERVIDVAGEEEADQVLFLGDLHHTFAVTNVKVVGFYREWFKRFNRYKIPVVALVGNHDMPGNGSGYPHALIAYEDLIKVVGEPWWFDNGLYLPYYADHDAFHKEVEGFCSTMSVKRIYCHQEFNGAAYDNGFFAPHGADPAKMPVQTISGHIHTPQTLGKVWYPGAPRWRTLSDAGVARYIHMIDTEDPEGGESFNTGSVCRQIFSVRFNESDPTEPGWPDAKAKDEIRVAIEGKPEYVNEMREKVAKQYGGRAKVSCLIKDKRIRVRESDGIDVAFKKYVSNFQAKNATPPAVLEAKVATLFAEA